MASRKSIPHVIQRGNAYSYHRRVPKHVINNHAAWQRLFNGRPMYREALGTSDYAEALERAAAHERRFNSLVAEAETGVAAAALTLPALRPITPEQLAAVSSAVRDSMIKEWRQTIKRATIDEEAAEYLHWRLENEIAEREQADGDGAVGTSAHREQAARINRDWGFNLTERSGEFAELVMAVRDGRTQGDKDVADLFAGKSLPDAPSSTLMSAFGAKKEAGGSSPTFTAVVREQRKVSGFAQKTLQKGRRAQELFVRIVGDKPVHLISRDDIHRFLEAVSSQQVGNQKGRMVTQATVQSYLTMVRSPLNHAVERAWILSNPAAGVKVKNWAAPSDPVKRPPKRPFAIHELNKLFQHPWFAGCASQRKSYKPGALMLSDMRYWAPVMSLYTGARASELGGLKLSEVFLDGTPHIRIQPNEYRRTKSGKARIVPVLNALVALGFLQYVERVRSTGSDRLFPDWECPNDLTLNEDDELSRWANSSWIRAFNRTVVPAVFPRESAKAERSALTFHSFRGSFKTLLSGSGSDKKANAVLGHSETKLDKAYILEATPEDLHAEFSTFYYKGLVLPSRLSPHPSA